MNASKPPSTCRKMLCERCFRIRALLQSKLRNGFDRLGTIRSRLNSSVQVSERYGHLLSGSKEHAVERMMAEYGHIGENGTVDPMETALSEDTPHKSPHSGIATKSGDSRKLLL